MRVMFAAKLVLDSATGYCKAGKYEIREAGGTRKAAGVGDSSLKTRVAAAGPWFFHTQPNRDLVLWTHTKGGAVQEQLYKLERTKQRARSNARMP